MQEQQRLTGKCKDSNVANESGQEGVERKVSDEDHVNELYVV